MASLIGAPGIETPPWDEEQLAEFLDRVRGLTPIASKFITNRGERLGLRIYKTGAARLVWILRIRGVPVGAGSIEDLPVDEIYVATFSVIDPMHRGSGHYQKVILVLNDFFDGRLCSDRDGWISSAAEAAWKKMGAKPRRFGESLTRFCFPPRKRR